MARIEDDQLFEPIAIVGLACRLPGGASTPSKLWELLENGRSAQSKVPINRFNIDTWYHPDPQRKSSAAATGGYFLSHDDEFRNFDPLFFGINPLEAASLDPQQRKLLEVVYEAFESAGTTLEDVAGSLTACYVGAYTIDYGKTLLKDTECSVPYSQTVASQSPNSSFGLQTNFARKGGDLTVISNRINYVFDLRGPSFTVDTACSSSLYALHCACQSLILRDCNAAVVGGTNIILDIEYYVGASRLGIMSPTGTCHTLDESADGFGRSDGVTALYIKRFSDALRDGDPIRGVIRSTAINTNGRGPGITHPGTAGQEAVIRKAYSRAGIGFDETGYFELHGTGTPVGDPIECAAVGNIFAAGRSPDKPLLLTALKSNIGHTESASGLASIIKVVLSLEKGLIPPIVGIKTPNPQIDFREGRLKPVLRSCQWPEHLSYRRASVNSFGYGGANAHVIVDAAASFLQRFSPPFESDEDLVSATSLSSQKTSAMSLPDCDLKDHAPNINTTLTSPGLSMERYLLVFSAHDEKTLRKNISAVASVAPKYDVVDMAYTLGAGRSHLPVRAFTVASNAPELLPDVLKERNMVFGREKSKQPVLAFIFTGQGAQWPEMGKELLCFPKFRETLAELTRALAALPAADRPDLDLIDELSRTKESSRMDAITVSASLTTALQVALVDLLYSWGVRATAVVGHSNGEAAAAYTAGYLTASETVVNSYYRALSIVRNHVQGAMVAVGLSAEKTMLYLEGYSRVTIACHNSPDSVTLSGDEQEIDQISTTLRENGVFAKKLSTAGNGFHSMLTRRAGEYFEKTFQGAFAKPDLLSQRPSKALMFSSVTNTLLGATDVDVSYWRNNMTSPVLFNQAVQTMFNSCPSIDYVVEIGPHSALSGPFRQIRSFLSISPERVQYLPTVVRGQNGIEDVLRLVGKLFINGCRIDVCDTNCHELPVHNTSAQQRKKCGRHLVDLPTYQWNYESTHWVENRISLELRYRNFKRHDILGSRHPGSSQVAPSWRNMLSLKDVPWLYDHKIGNDILFPASGYVAMAIEAASQTVISGSKYPDTFTIHNLSIASPIILTPNDEVETVFDLWAMKDATSQISTQSFDFRITSTTKAGMWTNNAAGKIVVESVLLSDTNSIATVLNCATSPDSKYLLPEEPWYDVFEASGMHYGPSFRTLSQVHELGIGHAMARIALNSTEGLLLQESEYLLHPATLDGCLQLSFIAASTNAARSSNLVRASPGAHHSPQKRRKILSTSFRESNSNMTRTYLPFEINRMKIWNHVGKSAKESATISGNGEIHGLRKVKAAFEVFDDEKNPLVQASVSFISVEGGFNASSQQAIQPFQRLIWMPAQDSNNDMISKGEAVVATSSEDPLWLVYGDQLHSLGLDIARLLELQSIPVKSIRLPECPTRLSQNSRVVMLAELEKPVLSQMNQEQFIGLQALFKKARSIVWITSGGLLKSENPEQSLIFGMLKAIRAEIPTLRLYNIDLSSGDLKDERLLHLIVQQSESTSQENSDYATVINKGKRYVPRYFIDEAANTEIEGLTKPVLFEDNFSPGLSLDMMHVGQVGSFYFKESTNQSATVNYNQVVISPRGYSLSRRDLATLRGQNHSKFLSSELYGVISRTMPTSSKWKVGDYMICLKGGNFDSEIAMHTDLCLPVKNEDVANHVLGLLTPVSTAMYAIADLGRLRSGQTALIHVHDELLVAAAAVEITQKIGAKILLIYERTDEKTFLSVNCELEEKVFISADHPDLTGILLESTHNHGIDLIFAGSGASNVSKTWTALAPNGRLVLSDPPPSLEIGLFETSAFRRGASLVTFTFTEMTETSPGEVADVMRRAYDFIQLSSKLLNRSSVKRYQIKDLEIAAGAVIKKDSYFRRVMLECNPESLVPVYRVPKPLQFNPDASYLLVGCLGGLGRSIASWMRDRGARHFVFLSRSGADKPEASSLIKDLKGPINTSAQSETTVEVFRGDVTNMKDVEGAIGIARRPIRGVVQAAVVFKDAWFDKMTLDVWNAVVQSKVRGTMNLHKALLSQELDFFVMTSSAIGVVGPITQTHYTAANGFLDSFARHRWSLGLPATSISIGMVLGVGHVAENPDIEELFLRRRGYGIYEAEFLQYMERACRPIDRRKPFTWSEIDPLAEAHILTGFDPTRLVISDGGASWIRDPSLQNIGIALQQVDSLQSRSKTASMDHSLPVILASATSISEQLDRLRHAVLQKLSSQVLIPVEKLQTMLTRPLTELGMDSIISAELRAWVWIEVKAEVSFAELLEGGMTLDGTVELIWRRMDERLKM